MARLSCPVVAPRPLVRTVQESAKVGEHRRRVLLDVAPGVAAELITARPRLTLALAVPLPGVTGVVVAEAVQLDRETMGRPAAVDVSAVHAPVHPGLGKAGGSEALEKTSFEPTQGHWDVSPEDAPEFAGAGPIVATTQDPLELCGGGAVPDLGLVDGTSQLVLLEIGGEVDEGALDGSDRNPAPAGRVGQLSPANAMADNPADPPLRGGQNFRP
jgi:hypothetical protein